MNRRSSGSVWSIALGGATSRSTQLARDLAFPYGLAAGKDDTLLVSEAWRHRVVAIDPRTPKSPRPVLSDLPAYPSRITPTEGGGYWLALFAPRNQLVEFVLREDEYRRRMIDSVDPVMKSGSTVGGSEPGLRDQGETRPVSHSPPPRSRLISLTLHCPCSFTPNT